MGGEWLSDAYRSQGQRMAEGAGKPSEGNGTNKWEGLSSLITRKNAYAEYCQIQMPMIPRSMHRHTIAAITAQKRNELTRPLASRPADIAKPLVVKIAQGKRLKDQRTIRRYSFPKV